MDIETKYAANLFFPNPSFVQVYLEAIANALDAEASHIEMTIICKGQQKQTLPEIEIRDDGVGFTTERFERFRKLQAPHDKLHKGLGRLVYLHYFKLVEFESFFSQRKRVFIFSEDFKGLSEVSDAPDGSKKGTRILFKGFSRKLRSLEDIKPSVLKRTIMEHFLPRFHMMKSIGRDFYIRIELQHDETARQQKLFSEIVELTADDVPRLESKSIEDSQIDIFGQITMSYLISKDLPERIQLTAIAVDERTIPIQLVDSASLPQDCTAVFIFESELFKGSSDSSRQRIVLPDSVSEDTLFSVLRKEAAAVLSTTLPEIKTHNQKTRKDFEDRYPHLLGLFEEHTVGFVDRDYAIEAAQRRFFCEQRLVLDGRGTSEETYLRSLEISSRTLTAYILYRDLIIKKLGEITASDKESAVHELIVPRYQQIESSAFHDHLYKNNIWLLDDKFMSFRTILSERKMRDLISVISPDKAPPESDGRPDIALVFSADPESTEKVDVVVIELKPRKADEKENNFATVQLVNRANMLVDYCPNIQRVWYFAILEIDAQQARTFQSLGFQPLFPRIKSSIKN